MDLNVTEASPPHIPWLSAEVSGTHKSCSRGDSVWMLRLEEELIINLHRPDTQPLEHYKCLSIYCEI